MRRNILPIFAAAILFISGACLAAVPRASMVRVSRGSSAGSGVVVHSSTDGRHKAAITCWHVLRDDRGSRIYVSTASGRRPATLVAADAANDMAIVTFSGDQTPPAPWADRYEGSQYTVAGFGQGRYAESVGHFKKQWGNGEMQWSAIARSGDSGGGLFDERGRLVGVVWGNADPPDAGAFTKNVSRMTALLAKTQCRNVAVRQANVVCGPQGCFPQDPIVRIQPTQPVNSTPPAVNGGVSPPPPAAGGGAISTVPATSPPAAATMPMVCIPIVSPTPGATYQQAEDIRLQLIQLNGHLHSLRTHLGN